MALGSGKNRSGLPKSSGGDETIFLSGKTYNAILDRLGELEGLFHPDDFDVKQGKDGKQVRLRQKKQAPDITLTPLQGSFRDDDGTWKLKFVPGYVRISTSGGDGEIVPEIGGVAIDAEDPPELSVVNANRIYLKVTASFTSPQSATVTIENLGINTPNSSVTSTGFTGYFFIAQFFERAGSPTLNQGQGGNVQVMVWGASIFFWRL